MSTWVLGRKAGNVAASVYAVLAKCRQKSRQNRQAELKQHAGKLAAGRGTWQRSEKAKELAKERARQIADKTLKEKRAKELNPRPKTKVKPAKKAAPKPPPRPTPKATAPKPTPPADHVAAHRAAIEKAHEEQRKANAAHAKANPRASSNEHEVAAHRAARAAADAETTRIREEIRELQRVGDPHGLMANRTEMHRQAVLKLDRLLIAPKRTAAYADVHAKHPDVIPPGPIADRLKAYTVGDAKVKAIQGLAAHHEAADFARDQAKNAVYKKIMDAQASIDRHISFRDKNKGRDAAHHDAKIAERQAEIKAHQQEHYRLTLEGHEARVNLTRHVHAMIELPHDVPRLAVTSRPIQQSDPMAAAVKVVEQQSGVDSRKNANEASAFVSRFTAAGDEKAVEFGLQVEIGHRANYSNDHLRTVKVDPTDPVGVHVHEQGHGLEHTAGIGGVPAVDRAHEFLAHRVGDEPTQPLKKVFPNRNYRDDEVGRKDKFDAAFGDRGWYLGKDYGKRATEITSMALQKFHEDPIDLVKKDPELAKFLFGMLDGSLR